MPKTLALLAALIVSVGLVACGGSDDGSGGSSDKPALSKNDYIQRLNNAQNDFVAEASSLNLSHPSSPKSFKQSLDTLVGNIDSLVAKMKDLHPPENVSAQHDKLISHLEDFEDLLQGQKDGLASGDRETVRTAVRKIADGSNEFGTSFGATVSVINRRLQN